LANSAPKRPINDTRARFDLSRNRLLALLPRNELRNVSIALEEVPLVPRVVLEDVNGAASAVYFVGEGIVSLSIGVGDGAEVETALIGAEGVVGAPAAIGAVSLPWRATVRAGGRAWRLPLQELRALMQRNGTFSGLLHRYVGVCCAEASQLAACASRHTIAQRIARWLLTSSDKSGGQPIVCTHENLSLALGVRRAGVTVSLGQFEAQGVLRQHRGSVTLLNRARLEAQSCGCYRLSRLYYEQAMG
jgi:CRP-like cAMP-binding protein